MNLLYVEEEIARLLGYCKDACAIWKSPGEASLQIAVGKFVTVDSLKALAQHSGFVMSPFNPNRDLPITVLVPNDITTYKLPKSDDALFVEEKRSNDNRQGNLPDCSCYDEEYKGYRERFNLFLNAVNQREFSKLVLSRKKELIVNKVDFELKAFLKACYLYNDSYVYICKNGCYGTWIGASPEVLLCANGVNCTTVALAGTMPDDNNQLPDRWDSKNRVEQAFVADYLREIVHNFDLSFKESGPFTVKAGRLLHLKTVFTFKIGNKSDFGDFLEVVHPTPAVCGLPKGEALKFILENEGYKRGYYTGFVGKLNIKRETELYVNLRCMKVCNNIVSLYAGGGIVKGSVANDEWIETERKMATMHDLLFD